MSEGLLAVASVMWGISGAIQHHQLIILGSGPAGLTAAIYAGRAKLKPCVVSATPSVLASVLNIDNWPGQEKISGADLLQPMLTHAKNVGAQFLSDEISAVDLQHQPFILTTTSGDKLSANAIIIAVGMRPKRIGCPGEETYWGNGVCNCALCDGPLYTGQSVAVVGGGMMALQNVVLLGKYASKIILLNDKKVLSAPKAQIAQALKLPNIEVIHECKLLEILGDNEKVTGIKIKKADGQVKTLAIDGVFISIGYESATGPFKGQLDMDEQDKIKIDALGCTNKPGVFAAGNSATIACSQAIVCAGSGAIAAVEAEKYLGRKPRKKTLLSCQKS